VISDTEKLKNDLDPVFGEKLISKLASLLTSNVHTEISHSLQIFGIFFANESLAQHFMKNHGMVLFHNLLSHNEKEVRKSTCFAIRRITSIHTYQVKTKIISGFRLILQSQVRQRVTFIIRGGCFLSEDLDCIPILELILPGEHRKSLLILFAA